mgnify:CR=1 FL=1|tara:strand:- start:10135 stop:10560 length:426 start_codon:yes stop_codon:yes gene_type:complete
MTIKEKIEQWSENLSLLQGTERLEYLLDLAKESTTMDPGKRIDERLIVGCVSQIWVDVTVEDEKVKVEYDSDALITKGITNVICDCFNNSSTTDCTSTTIEDFKKLGIAELLTAQRQNGLGNLISTILSRSKQLTNTQNKV